MAAPHFLSMLLEADPLAQRKRALRAQARARSHDPARDQALLARLDLVLRHAPAPVAFVWPLPGEPDLRPLMQALHRQGVAILLPVILAPAHPLAFRTWHPGAVLVPGPHGTAEPDPDATAGDPGTILVPLVAFDRARHRLGRGGGFYDRTLAARPGATAIGYAHADAEVALVPAGRHDRRLDCIVTDLESLAA